MQQRVVYSQLRYAARWSVRVREFEAECVWLSVYVCGGGRENRESVRVAVVACVANGFRAQNFGRSSQLQNWCSGRDYSAAAGIMSGSRRANRKFRFFSEYMKELLRKIVYSASPYVRLSVRLRSFGFPPSPTIFHSIRQIIKFLLNFLPQFLEGQPIPP